MFDNDYESGPTNQAQVDSNEYGGQLLGENELGTVYLHGDIGNKNSNVKIAYLIGMHPLESKSHRALFDTLNSKTNELNYEYCIYNINVGHIDEETEGRMDGQLLAQEFVAPHIIGNGFTFFVDIHSNKGLRGPGKYAKTNFVFAPSFDKESEEYMEKILSSIQELDYYAPEYRTSPEYITVPVARSGIPTVVYETYSYEKMAKTYKLAEKLVDVVDNLEFK